MPPTSLNSPDSGNTVATCRPLSSRHSTIDQTRVGGQPSSQTIDSPDTPGNSQIRVGAVVKNFVVVLRVIFFSFAALFRVIAYASQAVVAETTRLHARAQKTLHPRRYFWARFGPIAGLVIAVLVVPFFFASNSGPVSLTGRSSATVTETSTPTPVDSSTGSSTLGPNPTSSPSTEPTTAPVAESGGDSVVASGIVLPNLARTPGELNPSVTQSSIGQTICVVGWTSTIRPPSSVTTALKVRQLATGYSYNADTSTADYEEDHLISLELGGAPSAEANLWPEPYLVTEGARVKDRVENRLHSLVCSGAVSLATAQQAIRSNWWSAYQTYVGAVSAPSVPVPAAPAAPVPAQPVAPAPAPVTPPGGATALCNDGTYSYAAHHQGACSRHGGVKIFSQ